MTAPGLGSGNDLRAKLEQFVHVYGLCDGDWSRIDLQKAMDSVRKQAVREDGEAWEAKVEECARLGLLPDK